MKRAQPHWFHNPVIRGFHPDPSVCRVGRDFYLVTSSFEYFPGVPIFHSRDLVHWRQLGHVLTRKSQLDLTGVGSSGGIYAPTLRHHRGRFYLVTTAVACGGNFFVTARRPEGPWSDPKWIDEGGIDPSLTFANGRVYYLRNGEGRDWRHPEIHQAEIELKTGKLKRKLRSIWAGTGGVWPEGTHLYGRDGWFYLLAAEGGTSYEHSEVAARSRSPFGPFEPAPKNPILTHRHRPKDAIQATGHADLIELDDGSSWAVFLGVRPTHPKKHHLGRETFLAPVTWSDEGWPMVGRSGVARLRERAPALPSRPFPAPRARDDFHAPKLDPAWIFLRNPEPRSWSLRARPGFLRLRGNPASLTDVGAPAFVGRVQPEFKVRCRARLEFEPEGADEAGLVVRANESFHYALAVRAGRDGRSVSLVRRRAGASRTVANVGLEDGAVTLELVANRERYTFFVITGSRRHRLGALPTRGLAAETVDPTGSRYFTGVVLAMYATGNGSPAKAPADFDWFELGAPR